MGKAIQVENKVNSLIFGGSISIRSKLERIELSSQQILILEILLRGCRNKENGNAVNLTEHGVKYHVGIFFRKFKVRNRQELRTKIYDIIDKMGS